jgi:uncharacterized protein
MQTVLITGGTGLIGKALSKMLITNGYKVIILSRRPGAEQQNLRFATWDINKGIVDESAISDADYIVHLAGAGVADKKWTEKRKKEIVDSRVKSGELLVNTLARIPNKVKAFISASGVGWYGEDPQIPNPSPFTEDQQYDKSFLGETCYLWEHSLEPLNKTQIRLVKLRTGIVLSNDGGAFAEFRKPVRFGIAGILGHGRQVISWIHIDDICRQYLFAIENKMVSGVYNSVAPHPVSNKELTLTLARKSKGNFYIPINVPNFVLKIMLGSRTVEILKSTTVSTAKMHRLGFTFLYPSIEAAITQLLQNGK